MNSTSMTLTSRAITPLASTLTGDETPILVTGAHRSGTTWVATMLNLASGTLMTEEPMNIRPHRYALDGLAKQYFTYAPELPQEEAMEAFRKIIHRRTGKVFSRKSPQRYLNWTRQGRYIIKDPIACLSSDWLATHFDLNVLVLVRHPCAFAASLQRMRWKPDLSMFLGQEQFADRYISDLKDSIGSKDLSFPEAAAYAWKIIYRTLHEYSFKHRDWIYMKHESLALNPLENFRTLYDKLNLLWSDDVATRISEYTSPSNRSEPIKGSLHTLKRNSRSIVDSWKSKLLQHEIDVIRDITYPEWTNWYGEPTWS